MNASKKFLLFDLIVQSLLLLLMTVAGLASLVKPGGMMILYLLGQLGIGIWQIVSALGFTFFAEKTKERVRYLILALSYMLVLIAFSGIFVSMHWNNLLWTLIGWVFFPLGFAIWYWVITIQAHQKARASNSSTSGKPSFDHILDSGFGET